MWRRDRHVHFIIYINSHFNYRLAIIFKLLYNFTHNIQNSKLQKPLSVYISKLTCCYLSCIMVRKHIAFLLFSTIISCITIVLYFLHSQVYYSALKAFKTLPKRKGVVSILADNADTIERYLLSMPLYYGSIMTHLLIELFVEIKQCLHLLFPE